MALLKEEKSDTLLQTSYVPLKKSNLDLVKIHEQVIKFKAHAKNTMNSIGVSEKIYTELVLEWGLIEANIEEKSFFYSEKERRFFSPTELGARLLSLIDGETARSKVVEYFQGPKILAEIGLTNLEENGTVFDGAETLQYKQLANRRPRAYGPKPMIAAKTIGHEALKILE
jgi:hypothetical protein